MKRSDIEKEGKVTEGKEGDRGLREGDVRMEKRKE